MLYECDCCHRLCEESEMDDMHPTLCRHCALVLEQRQVKPRSYAVHYGAGPWRTTTRGTRWDGDHD